MGLLLMCHSALGSVSEVSAKKESTYIMFSAAAIDGEYTGIGAKDKLQKEAEPEIKRLLAVETELRTALKGLKQQITALEEEVTVLINFNIQTTLRGIMYTRDITQLSLPIKEKFVNKLISKFSTEGKGQKAISKLSKKGFNGSSIKGQTLKPITMICKDGQMTIKWQHKFKTDKFVKIEYYSDRQTVYLGYYDTANNKREISVYASAHIANDFYQAHLDVFQKRKESDVVVREILFLQENLIEAILNADWVAEPDYEKADDAADGRRRLQQRLCIKEASHVPTKQ